MDEAVDGGERHGLIGEHLAPFAERLIGRDQQREPFVAAADQFEQRGTDAMRSAGGSLSTGRDAANEETLARRPDKPRT
jgi:hypothetical protein